MHKSKASKLLVLLLTAVLLISGCAAPATPGTGAEEPAETAEVASGAVSEEVEPVDPNATQIVWLTLGGGNWVVDDVIAAFEEANPDINVTAEQVGFNELFQQIQIRFSAGSETPDVISVDVPLVAGYAVRGWLEPLDDVFTEEQRDDWLDAAVEAGSYEGHLLAAPVSTSTQLLFYNRDLLEEAGITPPGQDDRWTWEQVADVAQDLTQDVDGDGAPDVWGFMWEQVVRIYQLQPLPVSLGGEAIGEDGLTVDGVINSPEWIEAFTYYSNVFNEWGVGPQGEAVDAADLFEAGNLAMFVGGPWNIRRYAETDLPFEWGVSRHPYFAAGEIVTPTGSWHIGVNANSQNKEAAKRFVEWISTGEGAEIWWRQGSGDFPAQESILAMFETEPEFAEGPLSFMRTAADEATVNPVPRPVTPGYLEYEQILQDAFQDIRTGTAVAEALDTAAERIEREMRKYLQ